MWIALKLERACRVQLMAEWAGGPKLVQLQSNAFRCPYCGSRDTALENIFGPTPCRSVRYCRECRQPFEQFKTI